VTNPLVGLGGGGDVQHMSVASEISRVRKVVAEDEDEGPLARLLDLLETAREKGVASSGLPIGTTATEPAYRATLAQTLTAALEPICQFLRGRFAQYVTAQSAASTKAAELDDADSDEWECVAHCVKVLRTVRNLCAVLPVHQRALHTASSAASSMPCELVLGALPVLITAVTAVCGTGATNNKRSRFPAAVQKQAKDVLMSALQLCVNSIVQQPLNQQSMLNALLRAAPTSPNHSFLHSLLLLLPSPPAAEPATAAADTTPPVMWYEDVFAMLCALLYNCVLGSEARARALVWRFEADEDRAAAATDQKRATPAPASAIDHMHLLRQLMRYELALHPHGMLSLCLISQMFS
jgi:hypothetical protein